MLDQLLEYIKNNPQEIMFQAVLSVSALILVMLAATIWINHYRYRKHHGLGKKYFQMDQLDKSIEALGTAQRLAKKTLSGRKRDLENTSALLAEVAIAANRWDTAIQALTECIAIGPEKTEYHVPLVENYLRAGKRDRAREALDKALRLISATRLELFEKERVYAIARNRKDPEVAKELGRLAGSMAICRSERLDRLEILKPDFQGRRFILEGIAEGEEDNVDLARFYIRQYILEGSPPEKSEPEKDALEKEESEEDGSEDDVRKEEETADREEGAGIEEETREEDLRGEAPAEGAPMEAPAEETREEAQSGQAREEGASCEDRKSYLVKAREALDGLAPELASPAFYTVSAFLSVEEADPRAAEESYRQAIALDPQYAEAYYSLALLCVDEFDDVEGAIEHLGSAIESNPKFAGAHHNLALLLLGTGRDTGQIRHHLEEARRIDPEFSAVYYNLALLLARKDFKEFLLG